MKLNNPVGKKCALPNPGQAKWELLTIDVYFIVLFRVLNIYRNMGFLSNT